MPPSDRTTKAILGVAVPLVLVVAIAATALVLTGPAGTPTDSIQATTQDTTTSSTTATGTQCFTGRSAFEPTIGSTGEGHVFIQGGDLVPPEIFRSARECDAWSDVTPEVAGAEWAPIVTFDPYIHVDADEDRVFKLDMQGLQCNWIAFSDDLGASWEHNPVGCGHPAGFQDHPTLFTGPPATVADQAAVDAASEATGYGNVVYLCVNRVTDTACAKSFDGGLSFGPLRPAVFVGPDPNHGLSSGFCSGLTGHGVSADDGTIFVPSSTCSNAQIPDTKPEIAHSHDGGLTWDRVQIPTDSDMFADDAPLALDDAGNLYAAWVDNDGGDADEARIHFSVSTDQGHTWSDDVVLAAPGVNTASFPTVAAGAEGRVAVAFYGTDQTSHPDDFGDRVMDGAADWNGYLAVATDAADGSPTFQYAQVNPDGDPIGEGNCNASTRCDGVGDFIDITIDGEGRPWAAMVDAEPGEAGFAATLSEGPALRGPAGPLPPLG